MRISDWSSDVCSSDLNALAGRLPGVVATQSSAEPGYDGASVRIRGTNTLGNSGPLVVIDGIPARAGGFERLNPADIDNISVLKDASAAIGRASCREGVSQYVYISVVAVSLKKK